MKLISQPGEIHLGDKTAIKGDTTITLWKYKNGQPEIEYKNVKGVHRRRFDQETRWYKNGNLKYFHLVDKDKNIETTVTTYPNGNYKSYWSIDQGIITSERYSKKGQREFSWKYPVNDSTEYRMIEHNLNAYQSAVRSSSGSREDSLRLQKELKKASSLRQLMPILKFYQLEENPSKVVLKKSDLVLNKTRTLREIENEDITLNKLPDHAMLDSAHVYREYDAHGVLRLEIRFEDHHVLHGDYDEYYANGNPRVSGRFIMNKRIGTWEYFTEDGELQCLEVYEAGKKKMDKRDKYSCR